MVVALTVPATALGNDVPLSKAHFKRAMKLAGQGQHEASIREFELAYEANPRPSILFNIAHEYRELARRGSIEAARKSIDFYQRYLMVVPDASDRPAVETSVADLRVQVRAAEAESASREREPEVPPTATTPPPGVVAPDNPSTSGATTTRRVWPWVAVGLGVVAVVGGAIGLGFAFAGSQTGPDKSLGGMDAVFQ